MLQLIHLYLFVGLAYLKQSFLVFLDSDCEVVLRQQLRVYVGYLFCLCEDESSIEGLAISFRFEDIEQRRDSSESIDFIMRISDVAFEDGNKIVHFLLNNEMESVEFVIDMDILLPLLVDVLLPSDDSIQRHFLVEVVDFVDAAD